VTFNPIDNRDAWATIRGFVYQVDLTILYWFRLKDDQILELEKGEDFDVLTSELEGRKELRELGQVKFLEAGISLNQKKIIDILFNYYRHQKNNPDQNIAFRFLSNTTCLLERPSLFFDTTEGITAWEKLRTERNIDYSNSYFIGIKKHLERKVSHIIQDLDKESKDLSEWKGFLEALKGEDYVQNFISNFSWNLKSGDLEKLENLIKPEIRRIFNDPSSDLVKQIYERAFVFVFKILCRPERKILSQNQIQSLIEEPGIKSFDQELQSYLIQIQDELIKRVSNLETTVKEHSKDIASLSKRALDLENRSSSMSIDYSASLFIDAPNAIENGSKRKTKVETIVKYFEAHQWINLCGINGTGKSELACLICQEFETSNWLDLRSLWNHPEHTVLVLKDFLQLVSLIPHEQNRKEWLRKSINGIKPDTILVINDLPNPNDQELLNEFLIAISNELHSGIKLLTTSNHSFLKTTEMKLKDGLFLEYTELDFQDDEIEEYFSKNGAPDNIAVYLNLIATVTKRNPRLLTELLRFFSNNNWGLNKSETIENLLRGHFALELTEDTQFRIQKFIVDPEAKELLYRLSLIDWAFDKAYVAAVSDVKKSISHSFDKFINLVNTWFQKTSIGEYQASPLIRKIGEHNLSIDTQKNVHLKVADTIIKSGALNQLQAFRLISTFIQAEDHIQAGFVLINMYKSAETVEELKELKEWGFIEYWNSTAFPAKMPIQLQAQILHEQIRIKTQLGDSSEKTYYRLEGLLEHTSLSKDDEWVIRALCMIARPYSKISHLVEHLKYLIKEKNHPLFSDFLNKETVEGFVWLASTSINNKVDLFLWFDLIRIVELEIQADVFHRESDQYGITILANKIVDSGNFLMSENDENSYYEVLLAFAEEFEKRSSEILEAVIQKEIINFIFKIDKSEQKAIEQGVKLLQRFHNETAKYLINDVLGKLLYNEGKIDESIEWLKQAVSFDLTDQISFVETLTYLACAGSTAEEAVQILTKAVELSKKKDFKIDEIQVTAELGLAHWLNGDNKSSYLVFEKVMTDLNALSDTHANNKDWIRLNIWIGHALGYIGAIVTDGIPPEKTADGEKPYMKPTQGFFSFNNKDVSDHFDWIKYPILFVHMARFAQGVDKPIESFEWSQIAFTEARKNYDQKMFIVISSTCAQYSLINFKVAETMESALMYSAVFMHTVGGSAKERHEAIEKVDIPVMYKEKPSENWNRAEENVMTYAVIPMLIMAFTKSVNEDARIQEFLRVMNDYSTEASNKVDWEILVEIVSRIYTNDIGINELTDRSNTFGEQDRKHLQIICILGVIRLSKNYDVITKQILNVFPYILKTQAILHNSIVGYVVYPYIKQIVVEGISETFVGARTELTDILNKLDSIEKENRNCIQLLIQVLVAELDFKVLGNRSNWLYEFETI